METSHLVILGNVKLPPYYYVRWLNEKLFPLSSTRNFYEPKCQFPGTVNLPPLCLSFQLSLR